MPVRAGSRTADDGQRSLPDLAGHGEEARPSIPITDYALLSDRHTAALVSRTGSPTSDPHALGARAPRLLVRTLECAAGSVDVAVEFVPRPEYGLVDPLLAAVPGGVIDRGGADVLALSCPVPLRIDGCAARATLVLAVGQRATLGVVHRPTAEPSPTTVDAVAERLTDPRGLVYRYRTDTEVNAAWAISCAR